MRRHCEKTPALSQVSIHASVKDATIGSAYIRARKDVSIHASVKDATGVAPLVGLTTYVSIHASVKDATKVNDNEVSWF